MQGPDSKAVMKQQNLPSPSTYATHLPPRRTVFPPPAILQISVDGARGARGKFSSDADCPKSPRARRSRARPPRTAPTSDPNSKSRSPAGNAAPPAGDRRGPPNPFLQFPKSLAQLAELRKTVCLPDYRLLQKATIRSRRGRCPGRAPRRARSWQTPSCGHTCGATPPQASGPVPPG